MAITSRGAFIKDFWPDNTDTVLWIQTGNNGVFGSSLDDVLELASECFGSKYDLTKITITAEHIHTTHINYDLYDSSDYTHFIKLELES
jgi:hypothetical protein